MDLDDPLDLGLACLRPGVPFPIDDDLWFIHTDFFLGNNLNFHNNGLIIKVADAFVVVNLPKISKAAFDAIKKLAEYEKAEIKYLLAPSDFNNNHIKEWQKKFPKSLLCMVSFSALDNVEVLDKTKVAILDTKQPEIKLLKESVLLYPILGISKAEIAVFHRKSGTLFVADHLLPASSADLSPTVGMFNIERNTNILSNYLPCNHSINIISEEQARNSFSNILNIDSIQRIVFGHKSPREGCIYMRDDTKKKLAAAYKR